MKPRKIGRAWRAEEAVTLATQGTSVEGLGPCTAFCGEHTWRVDLQGERERLWNRNSVDGDGDRERGLLGNLLRR